MTFAPKTDLSRLVALDADAPPAVWRIKPIVTSFQESAYGVDVTLVDRATSARITASANSLSEAHRSQLEHATITGEPVDVTGRYFPSSHYMGITAIILP